MGECDPIAGLEAFLDGKHGSVYEMAAGFD
jgi:hypothetical protein